MAGDFSVPKLVKRWQELQQSGQTMSFADFCAACSVNQEEVQEQLQALASMVSFLGLTDSGSEDGPGGSAAAAGSTDLGSATQVGDRGLPVICLPGYEILRELGHGGMGVVFAARQTSLKRLVALKMIRGSRPESLARFRQEAEALARLQHPNIVQVFEIGEHDGQPFFSLEFVNGGSLDHFLKAQPQPMQPAARLVEILARAMHAAHQCNVVHRDLKPANVLMQQGAVEKGQAPDSATQDPADGRVADYELRIADGNFVPKITDFGLAKQLDADQGQTHSGAIMGTPSYMAPEQALGQIPAIGPHTDVYALGAILYEMLTGRPPFRGATILETLEQVRIVDPVPPSRLLPKLSRDLETICLKCLQKDPRQRYGTAWELAEDLGRFQAGEPVQARPIGRLHKAWRWARRKPAQAALLALVLLLLVGGLPALLLGRLHLLESDLAVQQAQAEAQTLQLTNLNLQQQEQAARELADTEKYFSLLNKVRQENLHKRRGWKTRVLEQLTAATHLQTRSRQALELRTEAVVGLAGVDLHPPRPLAKDAKWSWLAFTPDGKYLAVAPHNPAAWLSCTLQLLEVPTGQVWKQLTYQPSLTWQINSGKPDGPRELTISPDGHWLATGTRSGWVHCWNLEQDKPQPISWQAHQTEILGLLFTPDNQGLITSGGNSVRRWLFREKARETSRHDLAGKDGLIRALAQGPPGSSSIWIGFAPVDTMFQLDAVSLPKINADYKIPSLNFPLVVTRNGRLLVHVGDPDGMGLYLEALHGDLDIHGRKYSLVRRIGTDGEREGERLAHQERIRSLALSADEALLASTADDAKDRHLKVWEMSSGRLSFSLHQGPALGNNVRAAFCPGGRWLAVTGHQQVNLYELSTPRVVLTLAQHGHNLVGARWVGTEGEVACLAFWQHLGSFSELTLWRRGLQTAHKSFRALRLEEYKYFSSPCLAVPRGGRAAAMVPHNLAIHHLDDQTKPDSLRHISIPKVKALSYAPDGKLLWGLVPPNDLVSWRPPECVERTRHHLPDLLLTKNNDLAVLEAGNQWILAGSRDGFVYLFRSGDGQLEKYLPRMAGEVGCLALNVPETLAAFGTQQGSVKLVDLPHGEVRAELTGHDSTVTALAFSDDGAYLASGSADRTIRLWHKQQGQYLHVATLPGSSGVRCLQFRGHDPATLQLLVLGEREQTVRIWNVSLLREELARLKLAW